jgi:alanyl-tRNA synthetase
MKGNEIREKYLRFMEEKGHAIVPSSGIVPDNDPTTLFTGSGMQPMVPYLMGESHPKGTRLTDSQKCFRAEDIDEVGDNRHTTFFEMLGNWSLGDYFKEEQLPWMYSFLIDEIGLDPEKFYVTAFIGDEANNVPKDTVSATLWKDLFAKKGVSNGIAEIGSEEAGSKRGMKEGERIFYYDGSKNWWSRAGRPEKMPVGEIGGPDTEMFYDFGTEHDTKFGEHCHPNCDCGRFLEIGNNVFIEYIKAQDGSFQKLPKQNVDFGGGLERIAAASNNDGDVFKIDLLWNIVSQIQTLSGKKYEDDVISFRVITDHIRGAVFMIGDGILPGNSEQGYFVRRLLRRAVRYADKLGMPEGELKNLAQSVIETYKDHYTNLEVNHDAITSAIEQEESQFRKTLEKGMYELNKLFVKKGDNQVNFSISGTQLFDLYQSHGFPVELSLEIIEQTSLAGEQNKIPPEYKDELIKSFNVCMEEHRDKSRAGAEQKFKGGLADSSEKVVQYHTATHLMLAGLRKELGSHVHQAGSNITGERLRYDFTHQEKVTDNQLRAVEEYVNNAIQQGGEVTITMMLKSEAENDPSIEASFWDRYPDEVKVYTMKTSDGTIVSRELCGGPHVQNLNEIQGVFKIIKEESSSAGIRRIKAILE